MEHESESQTRITGMDDDDEVEVLASGPPCLVLVSPPDLEVGKRYDLDNQTLIVGRGQRATLIIERDSISRTHACFKPDGGAGQIAVLDLGSTNGTFVNNERVSELILRNGDLVRLGDVVFKFLAGGNVEASYYDEVHRLAISDPLTGAHNKRHLMEELDREVSRATRSGRPLSLLFADIDHFKAVNDTHGHPVGDAVLKELVARISANIMAGELFARYGGEEFVVVLPETDLETAMQRAERIREHIAATPFEVDGIYIPITLSLGVATSTGPLPGSVLVQLADENLYRAKRQGRNRTVG